MARRALIVGIDDYVHVNPLSGCVADAVEMASILSRNDDGSPNFDCQLITAPGYHESITRGVLREKWNELFHDFTDDILFYFSGHGAPTNVGGHLVVQDGTERDPGLPMNDLLTLANQSRAKSVLLILDCCFSGSLGNPANLQGQGDLDQAQLRDGVTVLAASRPAQVAMEVGGHGVFTQLVLGALKGGAMELRGHVSAAAVYAYAEAALGPWNQRPVYKSHASQLSPIRTCTPRISDALLRDLPSIFRDPEGYLELDPTFEHTYPDAVPENVEIFNKLKAYRDTGLAKTEEGDDLYYCALASHRIKLTYLGEFYRSLATEGRI